MTSRNDAAAVVEVGDKILENVGRELVDAVPLGASIDSNLTDSVRAAMRAKVRRLLTKYDHPPNHEEKGIELLLQQAESYADSADEFQPTNS